MERDEYLQNARFPKGSEGTEVLESMSEAHTPVTTWTLELLAPQPNDVILDVGCGGGRALKRLSPLVPEGRLYGVDYSETAVQCAKAENAADVSTGKLTVVQGSVSALPFPDNTFDKVYSIESYYFWPDLENDVREILRVLKPGGRVFIAADIHHREGLSEEVEYYIRTLNMTNLTFGQFQTLLENAGYDNVVIHGKDGEEWMCGSGAKPVK